MSYLSDRIRVTYALDVEETHAAALASRIAYEQTVELPAEQITDPDILARVVGRVESVEPGADGRHLALVSYAPEMANGQIPQLLNLIYGNASIYPGVRVDDLSLPASVLEVFPGPRFGVAGLRRILGVYGRPLLATALKPRGSAVASLARAARDFALGGGDIVKDDQNLVDDFESFKHRVEACRNAVEEANARTGRRCLYLPHVAAPLEELEHRFDFVRRSGLLGVLLCPLVLGLDVARGMCARHGLAMMAHPALTGSFFSSAGHGIAPELLAGTLFRIAGADISVFPNFGGRFPLTREQCVAIRDRLRAPLGAARAAWPAPAGGMGFDRIAGMVDDYGVDAVLLIGGSLLGHGANLRDSTHIYLDGIRAHCAERLETPGDRDDARPTAEKAPAGYHLRVDSGFHWSDRESTPYKDAADLAFKGVRRVNLVGKGGERSNFEMRYFEVAAGGFSSREKHMHTHVIVGARGEGVLMLGNEHIPIKPMDIAYVEPLQVHQLRNDSDQPFGFLCMVDRERDRPMKP